ncbi:hypothetical protein ABFS83_13G066000 [Erythranthe nasuta]
MDSSSNLHNQFHSCFNDWIDQQNRDLHELVAADISDGAQTKRLVEKGVQHFEDYCGKRAVMAQHDATSLMSPAWCTSLENAALWVGGCRPSLSIRLVYSVCGSELDEQLEEFLRGVRKGNLAEISGQQLHMINALHCRIVKEEDKISARIATLQLCTHACDAHARIQEEIADKPLAVIAKGAERVGEWSRDVERAANAHSLSLAGILVEADRLRLSTFKELMAILTPSQALDLLIATKKLHISMHEWGKTRDCHFGKTTISPP